MQKDKGFTIIELIVVIAIIAILAAIVLTNVSGYQVKGRNARRMADIKNYITALEIAFENNGKYPSPGADGVSVCLGSGNPGGKCWNSGYSESVSVNNALKGHYGIPIGVSPLKITFSGDYTGYRYSCSNSCKTITIIWLLEGQSQECGVGTRLSTNYGGTTYCRYMKSI